MINHATIIVVASFAIGISSIANAQHRQQSAADSGVIVCDARGCSDRPDAVRPSTQRASASHASAYDNGVIVCDERGCSDRPNAARSSNQRAIARRASANASASQASAYDANGNTVIVGGRPAGCPYRFCGCEASRYVFGKMRPELFLAANWIKFFPRTTPAPGMVAARPGHVMVLISPAEGNDWLVHDGNSGGGLTRRHVRSLRGYTIVDPHGSRAAQGNKPASQVE